jgi:hypothetical protein
MQYGMGIEQDEAFGGSLGRFHMCIEQHCRQRISLTPPIFY